MVYDETPQPKENIMTIHRPILVGNFYAPAALPTNYKLDYFEAYGSDAKFTIVNLIVLTVAQKLVERGAINEEGFYRVYIRPGLINWKIKLYRS
jgi:hypothetical protein